MCAKLVVQVGLYTSPRTIGIWALPAGSVKRHGVRLFVYRSTGAQQQTRCWRFAAVGPAGRRYRLLQQRLAAGGATLSTYATVAEHRLVVQKITVFKLSIDYSRLTLLNKASATWTVVENNDLICETGSI